MDKVRPVINHITWIGPDGKWRSRGFLPLYNHILRWDTDVKCPEGCRLAPRCHPMVQGDQDGVWSVQYKLCSLTVIRAGLIKEKELI